MAVKRAVRIETPGEPTPEPAANADAAAPDASDTGETSSPTAQPRPDAEPATGGGMTPEQEARLADDLVKTKELVGASEALDWSHLNSGLPAATDKRVDPDAGLPADADAYTITAPVLTKRGWVVPVNDLRARTGPK